VGKKGEEGTCEEEKLDEKRQITNTKWQINSKHQVSNSKCLERWLFDIENYLGFVIWDL
jgi:hypothetical protein